MMAYIIQQVAVGAICIVSIAALVCAAVDIFRLIREDFKGRGGRPPRPARTVADCVEER